MCYFSAESEGLEPPTLLRATCFRDKALIQPDRFHLRKWRDSNPHSNYFGCLIHPATRQDVPFHFHLRKVRDSNSFDILQCSHCLANKPGAPSPATFLKFHTSHRRDSNPQFQFQLPFQTFEASADYGGIFTTTRQEGFEPVIVQIWRLLFCQLNYRRINF